MVVVVIIIIMIPASPAMVVPVIVSVVNETPVPVEAAIPVEALVVVAAAIAEVTVALGIADLALDELNSLLEVPPLTAAQPVERILAFQPSELTDLRSKISGFPPADRASLNTELDSVLKLLDASAGPEKAEILRCNGRADGHR